MHPDLDRKLVEDFPLLYADRDRPFTETCMGFGFQCMDGWEPHIRYLSSQLEPLVQKLIDENTDAKIVPRVSCVKEKFGTLRFYLTCGTDEMFDLIHFFEEGSESICEACGKHAKLRSSGGWCITLCDCCFEKYEEGGYSALRGEDA